MTRKEIINVMELCSCGTRIEWTGNLDNTLHRGVVDEFHPNLGVIEPGHYIPVLGASEIENIQILEERNHDA